jgi:hypothetical protein
LRRPDIGDLGAWKLLERFGDERMALQFLKRTLLFAFSTLRQAFDGLTFFRFINADAPIVARCVTQHSHEPPGKIGRHVRRRQVNDLA